MGYLLPKEFLLLNRFLLEEEGRAAIDVEREVLGLDHCRMGAWLLGHWKLPETVVTAAREHHNSYYHGPDSVMVSLVQLADYLTRSYDLGEAEKGQLPAAALQELGLGEYQIITICEQVLNHGRKELDEMVGSLLS